jgi:hypothetical protein
MLDDELIKKISFEENGRELSHVWGWAYDEGDDFESRRDVFFWILDSLLRGGYIKFRKMNGGEVLEGTPEELVELFRKAWPVSELAADKISYLPGSEYIGSGGGMDLWFFMDECPAGVMWLDR